MDDKEFQRRYQQWLNTPYQGRLGQEKEQESNLWKYLVAGAAVGAGALAYKRLKGAKAVGGAIGKTEEKLAEGSKVLSKPKELDLEKNQAIADDIIKAHKQAVEHPPKFDIKTAAANVELRKPKGSTAPRKKTIKTPESKVEAASAQTEVKITPPKVTETPNAAAPIVNKKIIKQIKDTGITEVVRKGSSKPRKKSEPAVTTTVEKQIETVSSRRLEAERLLSQAEKSKDVTARELIISKAKALLSSSNNNVTSPPVTSAPSPVVSEREIKRFQIEKILKQLEGTSDVNERGKLIKEAKRLADNLENTSESIPPGKVPLKHRTRSNYEKRAAKRAAEVSIRPPKTPGSETTTTPGTEDAASEFLKQHGFDETGEVMIPAEIAEASRGGLTSEDVVDLLPQERTKVVKQVKESKGGKKFTGVGSLTVESKLPPDPDSPVELAKRLLRDELKNRKKND